MLFFQQNKKVSFAFYLSHRSLSPFFSLSFAGLPPTFSFPLPFSCSIFQIDEHDNQSKLHTSVNSNRPPPDWPPGISVVLPWMANSRGWGLLSVQIPLGEDEKRVQIPRPPSTLQHFSLIAQSNSAILSILICDFFVSVNVFLCKSAWILIKTSRRDEMH